MKHKAHRHASSRHLFLVLLALLLLYPLASLGDYARYSIYAVNWLVLLAAVLRLANTRRRRIEATVLATIQVAVTVWALLLPPSSSLMHILRPLEAALLAGFYLYAIRWILGDILRGKEVTRETLYGGLAAYLMLGLAWASAYAALELLAPGSLKLDLAHHLQGGLGLMYFSFVTLTTLGYGDILPLSDTAQSLSILEAITGQLYLAVMVARIVSAYHPKPPSPDSSTAAPLLSD